MVYDRQVLSGDDPASAQRLDRVRPVPGLRRRDPQDPLLDERDQVVEHPLPHGHAGAGSFPDALKALYLAVRSLNLKDTAQFRAPYSSWLSDPGNTRGTHIGDVIGSDTAVLMVVHEAGQGLFDELPQRKA